MKPMIKYSGGKSREICCFEQYIPKCYDRYIEPFVGGGGLFFYLEPSNAIINDVNSRVYSFYQEMKDCYFVAREQLNRLQVEYTINQTRFELLRHRNPTEHIINKNEQLYYQMRDMFNHKIPSEYLDCVIYFFINKTAYSGMIRYNSGGDFNVPFGRYVNFNTQLLTEYHHSLLQQTSIYNQDYSSIFNMAKNNDFMFLDPPYDCKFSDYGNINFTGDFGEDAHIKLANDFKQLSCKALMVIGKTKFIEDLYKPYIVAEYDKHYSVNIKNRFNQDTKHIVICNY